MVSSVADTALMATPSGKATARSSRQHDTTARGGNSTDSSTTGTTRVLNLGSYASPAGQSNDSVDEKRLTAALKKRAELQERGYVLAGRKRSVHRCGCDPRRRDQAVALGVGEHGGVQVAGMQHCGSRWCPRCWGLVTKERASDVQHVTNWAADQGYTVALVTLTASHLTEEVRAAAAAAGKSEAEAVRMQELKPLLTAMQGAWRGMISGKQGKALRSGWIGYARAVELTADNLVYAGHRTETGYHVHWHTVLILDGSTDLDDLGERLFDRWQSMCARRGLRASKEGFDLQKAANPAAAAAYVTKGEVTKKSLGHELASSGTKTAGQGRVTPEEILRNLGRAVAQTTGTKRRKPSEFVAADLREPAVYPERKLARLRAQWQEIEEAFDGARWLTWSRDLRKLAGLGQEETAEEVANAAVAPQSSRVAVVSGSMIMRRSERGLPARVTPEEHADPLAAPTPAATPAAPLDPDLWGRSFCSQYEFWLVKRQLDVFMACLPEGLDPEQRFDAMTDWLDVHGFEYRVLSWEDWQEETIETLRAEGEGRREARRQGLG